MKLSGEQQNRLSELYRENFVPLLCYARSILRDHDAAEDVVQETFQIACRRADQLFASENPDGWLMNTLKNILHNRKRKFHRFLQIFTVKPLDEELDITAEPPGELDVMIQTVLTPEEYRIYLRVIAHGELISAAARELGLSPEACKKRTQRIRAKLRA